MRASPFLLACAKSNVFLCSRPVHKKVPAATATRATFQVHTSGSSSACSPESQDGKRERGWGGRGCAVLHGTLQVQLLQLASKVVVCNGRPTHRAEKHAQVLLYVKNTVVYIVVK